MTGVMCVVAGTSGAPPLVISISPGGVDATSSTSQNMTTTSTTVTVVSGGSGSYTYSWAVSGVVGMTGATPTNPSSATTAFSCTGVEGVISGYAEGRVTVTDTVNGKVTSGGINDYVTIVASFTGTPP